MIGIPGMAGVAVIVKLSTQLLTAAVSVLEAGPTVVKVSKSRRIEQILVGSEKKMLISSNYIYYISIFTIYIKYQ